ncbi:MAG: copper ion binding protein, partial [Clostridia bacterium]
MKKETYNISGMSCASCSSHVEKAVGKIDGVESASVNLATEKLTVEYHDEKISSSDIIRAVDDAGYGATLIEPKSPQGKIRNFKIGGMGCASCAARIQKSVSKLDGIESAEVNLTTEKLTVISSEVSPELIIKTMEDLGYNACEIVKVELKDFDDVKKKREIDNLWTKFIIAAVFAVPLLYIAMAPMVGLPIPKFLDLNTN